MAEGEKIRQHAKQAMQGLTNTQIAWKKRLVDFMWEILIILVAVNITLWFHNWSAKKHERELEKEFLIGIKADLKLVSENLESFVTYFQPVLDYYDTAWVQINERRIDAAYIDSIPYCLYTTNYFSYNNSRFESFKSSGYLRLIENKSLSESITGLYSSWLPWRESADKMLFDDRRNHFITYIGSKVRMDVSGKMIVSELLNNTEVKYQIFHQGMLLTEMRDQKQELAEYINKVIIQIDDELKERFNYKE